MAGKPVKEQLGEAACYFLGLDIAQKSYGERNRLLDDGKLAEAFTAQGKGMLEQSAVMVARVLGLGVLYEAIKKGRKKGK